MCTAVFLKYEHSQIRTRRFSGSLGHETRRAATTRASHHPQDPARPVNRPGRAAAAARLQPTYRPLPWTSCGQGGARLPAARAGPLAASVGRPNGPKWRRRRPAGALRALPLLHNRCKKLLHRVVNGAHALAKQGSRSRHADVHHSYSSCFGRHPGISYLTQRAAPEGRTRPTRACAQTRRP